MSQIIILLLALFGLGACSEDYNPLPNYRQDLSDIQTDVTGCAVTLTLDNDITMPVINLVKNLAPDTVCRAHTLYISQENGAHITDYQPILVTPIAKFGQNNLKFDPATLIACWQTPKYINLRLAIKGSKKETHYFGFHQTDFVKHSNGTRTLCAQLLHNSNDDPQYFTHETFLSIPLKPLASLLKPQRDSIKLVIQSDKGAETITFSY